MNHKVIYEKLISSRSNLERSKKTGYYELHHIIPKCLNGSDEKSNLILLTPREHFLAHYLLWKIYNTRKLRDALLYFKGKNFEFANSRLYEIARISHIKDMKENNPSLSLSEETKAKKVKKLKQYIKTPQHRENISKANKGSKSRLGAVLEEHSKQKISDSLKEYFKSNIISEETREKIRLANTGKKHSEESLKKQSEKALNRKKYNCPHCNRSFDGGNLKQHMKKYGFSTNEIDIAKTSNTDIVISDFSV